MSDVYTQENGSKKKFLAPLLVILLCMVSLTAAGYAYSSTVENTDDKSDVDFFAIDLYKTDGTTLINQKFTTDEANLVVSAVSVIDEARTVTITVDKTSPIIYVFGFKVTAEDTITYTVTGTPSFSFDVAEITPAPTTSVAPTATAGPVKFYTENTCENEITTGFTSGETYYAAIVFDNFTAGTYTYENPAKEAWELADAVENAITVSFGISLTAATA